MADNEIEIVVRFKPDAVDQDLQQIEAKADAMAQRINEKMSSALGQGRGIPSGVGGIGNPNVINGTPISSGNSGAVGGSDLLTSGLIEAAIVGSLSPGIGSPYGPFPGLTYQQARQQQDIGWQELSKHTGLTQEQMIKTAQEKMQSPNEVAKMDEQFLRNTGRDNVSQAEKDVILGGDGVSALERGVILGKSKGIIGNTSQALLMSEILWGPKNAGGDVAGDEGGGGGGGGGRGIPSGPGGGGGSHGNRGFSGFTDGQDSREGVKVADYMLDMKKAVDAAGVTFVAAWASNLTNAAHQYTMSDIGVANDPLLKRANAANFALDVAGSVPLVGGITRGLAGLVINPTLEAAEQGVLERDYGYSLTARNSAAQANSQAARAAGFPVTAYAGELGIINANNTAEMGKLNFERKTALLGARLTPEMQQDMENEAMANSWHGHWSGGAPSDEMNKLRNGKYKKIMEDAATGPIDQDIASLKLRTGNQSAALQTLFDMGQDQLNVNINSNTLLSQRRPVAAEARAIVGHFEVDSNYAVAERNKLDMSRQSTGMATHPNDVIAYGNINRAIQTNAHLAESELAMQRNDIYLNAYGGRPVQMGGRQSVMANRDLSPENNSEKLAENTRQLALLSSLLLKLLH